MLSCEIGPDCQPEAWVMRLNTLIAFSQNLDLSINLTVTSSVVLFRARFVAPMIRALYAFMTSRISLMLVIPWRPSSLANNSGSSMERLALAFRLDETMFDTSLSIPELYLVY